MRFIDKVWSEDTTARMAGNKRFRDGYAKTRHLTFTLPGEMALVLEEVGADMCLTKSQVLRVILLTHFGKENIAGMKRALEMY